MLKRPNKWLAAVLGFVGGPLGMLYVGQTIWAGVYFSAIVMLAAVDFVYLQGNPIVEGSVRIVFALVCAIHAYRLALRYPSDRTRPSYSLWYGISAAILAFVAVTFTARAFLVEPFRIPTGAMLPTIPIGSRILVSKWGYGHYGSYGFTPFHRPISSPLTRGDVIVFDYPPDTSVQYVKRLVGLPGDTVVYRDKQVWINGKEMPKRQVGLFFDESSSIYVDQFTESIPGAEHSVLINASRPSAVMGATSFSFSEKCAYDMAGVTCVVPAGHYYVLGDNRDNSADSRYWGFVPADHVVGKVMMVLP